MSKKRKKGSLTVVGTGIEAVTHITMQAQACIEQADKVFYAMADPITIQWIRKHNSSAESLSSLYSTKKLRRLTYSEMAEQILKHVRQGLKVCAAFYGHPGVLAEPGHAAIRQARIEGFPARMLPGISAMDCLYADVGLDPNAVGAQSYGATYFLRNVRRFDPRHPLLLWQIGFIGEAKVPLRACNRRGLKLLVGELRKFYPGRHKVILYEASQFAVCKPRVHWVRVSDLAKVRVSPLTTLYVPPVGEPRRDHRMARQLKKVSG